MSTVSDVSNTAVVPSENCSFLDEDFDSLPASAPPSEVPSPVPDTDAGRLQQLLDDSVPVEEEEEEVDPMSESQEEQLLKTPGVPSQNGGPKPLKELAAASATPQVTSSSKIVPTGQCFNQVSFV